MAFAETANLAVKLTLGGNFNTQLAKARAGLRGLDKESRAFRAGGQIGTGIKRGAIIAVAAVGTLTALLAQSVKEGQEAANVQKIYAQAIKNSGKVSADYVRILDDQQKALENLAGIDDELIKSSQTRLIQMGLTGKQVEKATPLVLDFAEATGVDLLTATKLFGKAANGNIGALSRYGVFIDKAKAKVDPFGAAIDALNEKFGGTTQALSGSLDKRLGAFRAALADIREEAGIKLLPVLTRIVDVAGRKLVPAFGKFVDRILPDINKGLDEFANILENGGAENAIRGITDALGPMIDLVKISAAPVKAIVSAFLSLPKEIQTVLVGAFAVNKLTGGLVGTIAGGVFGALKAMTVTAGVVYVNGGVGGPGGIPGAPGGLPPVAPPSGIVTPAIGAGIAIEKLDYTRFHAAMNKALGETAVPAINRLGLDNRNEEQSSRGAFREALAAIEKRAKDQGKEPTQKAILATYIRNEARQAQRAAEAKQKAQENIRATKDADSSIDVGANKTAGASRDAGAHVAAAIRANRPSIKTIVTVNVTAGSVQKATTVQSSYGPANGSSGGGYGPGNRPS